MDNGFQSIIVLDFGSVAHKRRGRVSAAELMGAANNAVSIKMPDRESIPISERVRISPKGFDSGIRRVDGLRTAREGD